MNLNSEDIKNKHNADYGRPQQPKNYPRFYGIPSEAKEYDEFKERVRSFLVRAEGDDTLPNLWALYLWNALAEIEKLRALIDGSEGEFDGEEDCRRWP